MAHDATVEKIETLLDLEAQIGLQIFILSHIMETVNSNHQIERARHTPDRQNFKRIKQIIITILSLITLEHNHLITKKMKSAHNNHSEVIAAEIIRNILTHN